MDHPLWHVYDELCTTRFNVHYYTKVLARARRWNRASEMVLAASSSTSVAGLWLLDTAVGGILWKCLATLAAVVAVYRAAERPSEYIRKVESYLTSYRQLELALEQLRRRIDRERRFTPAMAKQLDSILEVKRGMCADFVDADIDEPLRRECFEQVKKELPADRFFIPTEENRDG